MSDELKQQASIDSPEFRALLDVIAFAPHHEPAQAALIAHIDAWGARMAVPDGHRVVPNDSTDEMNLAGCDMLRSCGNDLATTGDAYLCWSAMLAAAPSPTKE